MTMKWIRNLNAAVNNPLDVLYIVGDANTDGSMRIVPDTSRGTEAEFQLRTDGVWNDTGVQIAASSIHIGRELLLSAAGQWLRSENADLTRENLIPRIDFTRAEGTDPFAKVPILAPEIQDFPFQPVFTDTLSGPVIGWPFLTVINSFTTAIGIKTGPGGADRDILVQGWRGPDKTGILYYSQVYPQDNFPENSDVKLELVGIIESVLDEFTFIEFSCVDKEGNLDPTGTLTLLGSDAVMQPYQEYDFSPLTAEEIMTSTTGMDRVLIGVDGNSISGNDGNLMLNGEAPVV